MYNTISKYSNLTCQRTTQAVLRDISQQAVLPSLGKGITLFSLHIVILDNDVGFALLVPGNHLVYDYIITLHCLVHTYNGRCNQLVHEYASLIQVHAILFLLS